MIAAVRLADGSNTARAGEAPMAEVTVEVLAMPWSTGSRNCREEAAGASASPSGTDVAASTAGRSQSKPLLTGSAVRVRLSRYASAWSVLFCHLE